MPEMNEEHKGKVRRLWGQTPEFRAYIEEEGSVLIQEADIILALMEATGKDFQELALGEWNNQKVLETISGAGCLDKFPRILDQVVLEESIIPSDVVLNINEEQAKFKGERWIVYKNDADPFPSNPHAHNYEAGLKLHLGNGELYNGTKLSGRLPCKKLKQLRGCFRNVTMPELEC